MSRARTIAIGTLVALLAAAPFLPRDTRPGAALRPSGERQPGPLEASGSVGPGEVSEGMRAEIDRVVGRGLAAGRLPARARPDVLAERLVRCATFDGQRYCLHVGWTNRTADEARDRIAAAVRAESARPALRERTGALSARATLRHAARLDPAQRARTERRELTWAARSVAKVWMLRHQLQGEPLPDGFLADHPEARTTKYARTTRTKTHEDYPDRSAILSRKRVSQQSRTYWCGPASMQMIAWGWQDEPKRQRFWSDQLGTTTNGTAISEMVRVVNRATGYDRAGRAGPYVVLDISDWSYRRWFLLQMRHIVDYRAPVVLHPVLLRRYFPYLDDDASGHFQVGRGYDKRGDKTAHLGFFEPWNQRRFDPSEPYIARVQWRSAYRSFRANKAHFQQNIGV